MHAWKLYFYYYYVKLQSLKGSCSENQLILGRFEDVAINGLHSLHWRLTMNWISVC